LEDAMGMPTHDPADRRNGADGNAVPTLLVVLVVLVLCGGCVGLNFVPPGWRSPLVIGVVVGSVALWFIVLAGTRRSRLVLTLAGVLATGGAVLLWGEQVRLYGAVALAGAVYLLLVTLLTIGNRPPGSPQEPRRLPAHKVARNLIVSALLVATALSVVGAFQRHRGSFSIAHGTAVTVELGDTCLKTWRNDKSETTCGDASWFIDGYPYRGTVHLAYNGELAWSALNPLDTFTTTNVQAYVIPGDKDAYSAKHWSSRPNGLEPLAFVPWWLGLPLLVAYGLAELVGWLRRRPGPRMATRE
jgi:hypothetical protein